MTEGHLYGGGNNNDFQLVSNIRNLITPITIPNTATLTLLTVVRPLTSAPAGAREHKEPAETTKPKDSGRRARNRHHFYRLGTICWLRCIRIRHMTGRSCSRSIARGPRRWRRRSRTGRTRITTSAKRIGD